MGTNKLAYQVSTALIVVLFAFTGVVKVVPGISPDLHDEMVSLGYNYIIDTIIIVIPLIK